MNKLTLTIASIFIFTCTTIGVESKQHQQKNRISKIVNLMEDEEVLIIPERSQHEGRELFTVVLPSGQKMEHMYIEEILNGMKNDIYTYDEDIK
jgi:hypothetical protein